MHAREQIYNLSLKTRHASVSHVIIVKTHGEVSNPLSPGCGRFSAFTIMIRICVHSKLTEILEKDVLTAVGGGCMAAGDVATDND